LATNPNPDSANPEGKQKKDCHEKGRGTDAPSTYGMRQQRSTGQKLFCPRRKSRGGGARGAGPEKGLAEKGGRKSWREVGDDVLTVWGNGNDAK